MGIEIDRDGIPGNPRSRHSIWTSPEFVFAITRGGHLPSTGEFSHGRQEFYEARETFEEAYGKYEFSELVRLSISFGSWLSRVLRKDPGKTSDRLQDGCIAAE